MSTLLLYPETRAALARAARAGRIPDRRAGAARRRLEELWGEIERIEPTETLARAAGDIAERSGLRGYDAVHLASYEEIADEQTVLVAADGDLVRAAAARGHATLPLPR